MLAPAALESRLLYNYPSVPAFVTSELFFAGAPRLYLYAILINLEQNITKFYKFVSEQSFILKLYEVRTNIFFLTSSICSARNYCNTVMSFYTITGEYGMAKSAQFQLFSEEKKTSKGTFEILNIVAMVIRNLRERKPTVV